MTLGTGFGLGSVFVALGNFGVSKFSLRLLLLSFVQDLHRDCRPSL
jgi:hypothetical protein